MKRFFTIFLCVMSLNVFAAEQATTQEDNVQAVDEILNDEEFLGCFSTRRECAHEARHDGYHHLRAVRDHHLCHDHHRQIACYGVE